MLMYIPAFISHCYHYAALHEKEGLEIQLTAPYRYLKCNRYIHNCAVTSAKCAKVIRIKISKAV